MITTGHIKKNMTAELWDYTTTVDPATGVPTNTYDYVKDISFGMTGAQGGIGIGVMTIYTDDLLRNGVQLRNIRDRAGKAVFADANGDEWPMEVGAPVPNIGVFGIVEGYQAEIRRTI